MRKIFLFVPILLALFYTVALALTQGIHIGVDVFFHLRIAENWASGNLGMFLPEVMQINHSPYPPLFHFLLVPGILLGFGVSWVTWIQILFMPIAIASFMFLTYKLYGTTLSFFAGFPIYVFLFAILQFKRKGLVLGWKSLVRSFVVGLPTSLLIMYYFLEYAIQKPNNYEGVKMR